MKVVAASVATGLICCTLAAQKAAPRLDAFDLSIAHRILADAYQEVKKNYYDPGFHNLAIDDRYRLYDSYLDRAPTMSDVFHVIAAFLAGFHDSHLFFEPPERATLYDSGYRMQMVGGQCMITRVRPHSDAASKLHPGDGILGLDSFAVNRTDIDDMQYYFHVLAHFPEEHLEIRSPEGVASRVVVQELQVKKKEAFDLSGPNTVDSLNMLRREETEEHVERERLVQIGDATVWKMPRFNDDSDARDRALSMARKHGNLILDLRGNPGGYTDTLSEMVGAFFDHDVKIADRVARKPDKPLVSKHTKHPFTGKLIVLVDSESASCAELFARVMQLEHRGTVLGDKTAGAVMEAKDYTDKQGADQQIFYSFSVTSADLVMTDGKSLEKVGVTPDEVVLPTPDDIRAERDPVLARALTLAGEKMDAKTAGGLFPYEWPPLE